MTQLFLPDKLKNVFKTYLNNDCIDHFSMQSTRAKTFNSKILKNQLLVVLTLLNG